MLARHHRRRRSRRRACPHRPQDRAFLAVSNGPDDILYLDGGALPALPVFAIDAVDTLGAGDAFHGGFVLALAEGRSEVEAMRFGAAVAGIKCSRLGGSAGCADPGRGRGAVGGAAVAGRQLDGRFRAGIGLRRRDAGIVVLDLE